MTFLRPELLQTFRDIEAKKWVAEQIEQLPKKEASTEKSAAAASESDKESKEESKEVDAAGGEEQKSTTAEKALADSSLIRLEDFKLEFNVDAFVERKDAAPMTEAEKEAREADPSVKSVRAASEFLRKTVLPNFLFEVASTGTLPGDGATLARLLHRQGINVRYLGRLAKLVDDKAVVEKFSEGLRHEVERHLQNFKV
jgi:protein TIF31